MGNNTELLIQLNNKMDGIEIAIFIVVVLIGIVIIFK